MLKTDQKTAQRQVITSSSGSLKPARKKWKRKKRAIGRARQTHISDLPIEVLNIVCKDMPLADCAVLALTCKDLALKLDQNGFLDWSNANRCLPKGRLH